MSESTISPPVDPAQLHQASSDRLVPTRRISFADPLADLPKHFAADGDLLLSHLAVALTSLFPDGEDFFVRSVRHYRDQITDPVLKKQVAGFIGQEAMHGREHRALNDRLQQLGYPVKAFEKLTRRSLALRTKVAPPIANLAVTAALEHFTATLAELLLSDERARAQFGHAGIEHLFVWHALEEAEHKAVAFDVYRAVGGSERMRVWTMKVIRPGLVGVVALEMAISLLGDRKTYRRGVLRKSWRNFRNTPMVQREMWQRLKAYDRPGFHPDDTDATVLLVEWRERLFGERGEISDLLVKPTSAA